jgi:hypothetical protein
MFKLVVHTPACSHPEPAANPLLVEVGAGEAIEPTFQVLLVDASSQFYA